MKIIFLVTSILFASELMQAQQKISDVQYLNPQTYGSKPDSLYNGHNFDYYNDIFIKATKQRNFGIFFTSASVGLYVGAFVASGTNINTMTVLALSSIASLSIGVPLWITGGVKRKKNKKIIEQINRNMNISFKTSNNGLGIVLNF